jgi:carboxylesterase type B
MSFNSSPVVKLDVGFIQGINVIVDGTIPIDIFYGVPFAEPPIGENRFEVGF